ncbi:MAG: serine/threonine-protein kinase [Cyanobacteria bacterium J06627_28]
MSSLIGKPLQGGKYKLESVLGQGGFGLTFRAHQNYLDQVVVIKTLNESFWRAPNLNDLQRQFQDEARRLALCSHPNVVRVSDFFVEDHLPYMVMDYIPGRSLYDIVLPEDGSPQPLSEPVAVAYVRQIGQALKVVHSKGLLHRDIKPQNIMVHQLTGEAVLIDFGIARELTQNPNKTHTSIVSEGYAPIEQYLPKAQRSAATDIYGLAATLYTLLTGQIPVAAVLRDRAPLQPIEQFRPELSPSVTQAIHHGLAVELKDRPQSVGPWLSQLSGRQRTGLFGRTAKRETTVKTPSRRTPSPVSEAPTKVVAPGIVTPDIVTPGIVAPEYPSEPAVTGGKTVAMPLPSAYVTPSETAAVAPQVQQKKKGCGFTLAVLTLAIAGIAGASGYWLYNQFANNGSLFPELSLPEVALPEIELPEQGGDLEESETTAEESPDEESTELPDKKPKPAKVPGEEENTEENAEEGENENNSEPTAPTESTAAPPLLLNDRGNPANATPGDTGPMVAIPGFSPGDTEDQIKARLGTPTQESSRNGYYTSVYDVVPNRVSLAYVYEQGDIDVRQSEATFSPATDRLVIRTTLSGMLDGRSTREIEQGLEAVRTGARDRYTFERRGFSGVIERNAYGHLHIYVQN